MSINKNNLGNAYPTNDQPMPGLIQDNEDIPPQRLTIPANYNQDRPPSYVAAIQQPIYPSQSLQQQQINIPQQHTVTPQMLEPTMQASILISSRNNDFDGNIFGDQSVKTHCRNCGKDIDTQVSFQNGSQTWCVFTVLMLLGCVVVLFWCCLCIPFCSNKFQDAVHSCPNCRSVIGVNKKKAEFTCK